MTENFQGLWSLSFDRLICVYPQSVGMRTYVLHIPLPSAIMMMDCQSVLRLAIPHTARSREPIYNTLLRRYLFYFT